ncbi:MAG: pectinesterase family protein [Methanosarcina barkeri]|nr:pectinesterase family protein [Methanosarcina sp. ERenArc_MAG2]
MEELDINKLKLLLLAFFIFTLSSFIGAAATYTVATDGTGNYATIQAAVDKAASGDIILVQPGTYTENIVITKANLELRSASDNPEDTIIASNTTGKDVIYIGARANSKIKGFTISGATGATISGISMSLCNGCTIENNKFLNNNMGISLKSSGNIVVHNNTATVGTGTGIYITQSYSTTISGNKVSGYASGIKIDDSQGGNTVSGNTVSQISGNGIGLEDTSNNALESNIVSSTGNRGIYLARSSKNNLKNNIISSSGSNGIEMELSSGNTVFNNTVSGNTTTDNNHGIFLYTCTDSYVQSNTVSGCEYGIAMRTSENNSVVNNNAYENGRGFYVAYTSSRNTLSRNKANSNSLNGITLISSANNNIVDNNEVNLNGDNGIYLETTNNNKISNNAASQNSKGIVLKGVGSTQNTLSNNILDYNSEGIRLDNSSGNDLINNTVSSSNTNGIFLVGSCNNNGLQSNTVRLNRIGIYVTNSTGNTLSENIVSENGAQGILIMLANNNTLSRNNVNDNIEGISLNSAESNNISGNNIISNGKGIYMCPRSYYNLVFNNCFNNPNNADVKNNQSYWNIAKTSGKNVMGGPTLGGNFWGTPSGLGFSDTKSDTDGDGIIDIDIPFVTDNGIIASPNGNIRDNFPLIRVVLPVVNFDAKPTKGFVPLTVEFKDLSTDATSLSWDVNGDGSPDSSDKTFVYVYETPGIYTASLIASNKNGTTDPKTVQIIAETVKIYPVADFNANLTSGYAPLSVQFTDLSQYATSRSWDFGDGTASIEQNPMHTYSAAGTYTVNLKAGNENGTSPTPKTATITVTQQSSSSGGSGGGSSHSSSNGGGGAGGSPEPAKNVQVKEISQAFITNGKAVKFDFAKNATCVVYVGFDSKKTAGKTTTIAEQLKGKSTLVSELDSGEIYKYFNLWVGNGGFATSDNIENPVVCFKVEKSWIQDKKIDQASIILNRYNEKKWAQLPVTLLREDNRYLYFTAKTSGFSFFAITGKSVETESGAKVKSENTTQPLEQNKTTAEAEQKTGAEQEPEKGKITSIPGFEMIFGIACLITVFIHKRK